MRPAVQLSKQPRYWYPSPLGAAGDFNGIGRDIGVVIDDKVSDAAVDQSGALRWQRRPARHARGNGLGQPKRVRHRHGGSQ